MVSPHLSKKKSDTLTVSLSTRKLFQVVYREQNKEVKVNEDEARIKVSELISKVAFFMKRSATMLITTKSICIARPQWPEF